MSNSYSFSSFRGVVSIEFPNETYLNMPKKPSFVANIVVDEINDKILSSFPQLSEMKSLNITFKRYLLIYSTEQARFLLKMLSSLQLYPISIDLNLKKLSITKPFLKKLLSLLYEDNNHHKVRGISFDSVKILNSEEGIFSSFQQSFLSVSKFGKVEVLNSKGKADPCKNFWKKAEFIKCLSISDENLNFNFCSMLSSCLKNKILNLSEVFLGRNYMITERFVLILDSLKYCNVLERVTLLGFPMENPSCKAVSKLLQESKIIFFGGNHKDFINLQLFKYIVSSVFKEKRIRECRLGSLPKTKNYPVAFGGASQTDFRTSLLKKLGGEKKSRVKFLSPKNPI
eukprot:snap_masked-scaffold_21-processed-gene-5.56-mRNA-1 protein AED:1.00 eAED:1.00 QI:0/-1/0/0/-1/1/1/0/341